MPEWIVKDLIPQGDSVFSLGYPGAGKSWVLDQLAYAAASGHCLFPPDAFEVKMCSVILIDEDTPTDLLDSRTKRIAKAFGVSQDIVDIRSMTGWRLDRNTEILVREMQSMEQPVLVIIDSLSKVMPPKWDPNNTSDAIKTVRHINRLKGVGTVVTAHHISEKKEYKFGDPNFDRKAMGNTQLNAGCDTIFGVFELCSYPTVFGIQPKTRRTQIVEQPFAVELREDSQRTWALLKLLDDVPSQIPALARKVAPYLYWGNGPYTVDEFGKETKGLLSRKDTRVAFDYLVEVGFAKLTGHQYSLNPEMKSPLQLLTSVQEELVEYCKGSLLP